MQGSAFRTPLSHLSILLANLAKGAMPWPHPNAHRAVCGPIELGIHRAVTAARGVMQGGALTTAVCGASSGAICAKRSAGGCLCDESGVDHDPHALGHCPAEPLG